MKKIKIVLMVMLLLMCGSGRISKGVWVCTGKSSTKYHLTNNCRGLNKCRASIEFITLEKAKELNYGPCKICYKNTSKKK